MADSMIQLSPDSTGKKVDTEELTIGANSVHRERMQIAGDSATDIAPVTAADGLLVNLGTNNDVTVATLPLPSGAATLAEQQSQTTHLGTIAGDTTAIETAVQIIDDWDEADRAKVNPIVGQAGVAAGAGAVGVTVQRVTLASDDPAVAALQILDNAISGSEMQVDIVSSALPTGAATLAEQQTQTTHLATIAGDTTAIETAVQIMDDWDETNRAAVNTIAGQVGVQGASGTVTALTQRVVLATDVGLPAGTANIGDVDVLTMPVVEIVGDVAADAAVPTNPVIIGGRASTAQPTPVSADGDSVNLWTSRKGAPIVSMAPHVGLLADPWALTSVTAQYTTTQTSTVLLAGGASERIVVTKIGIQAGATTAATVQVYFGTGAYSRGTSLAIFDGEFAPSATLKPGVRDTGPFISAANGDDVLVTTSAGITLTVTIWYYVLV